MLCWCTTVLGQGQRTEDTRAPTGSSHWVKRSAAYTSISPPCWYSLSWHRSPACYLHKGPPGNYSSDVSGCGLKLAWWPAGLRRSPRRSPNLEMRQYVCHILQHVSSGARSVVVEGYLGCSRCLTKHTILTLKFHTRCESAGEPPCTQPAPSNIIRWWGTHLTDQRRLLVARDDNRRWGSLTCLPWTGYSHEWPGDNTLAVTISRW